MFNSITSLPSQFPVLVAFKQESALQNEIADKSREDISYNLPKENPKSNNCSKKKKIDNNI